MRGEPGFFDVDDRLRRLSDLGDQLEAFGRAVDFEIFRAALEAALGYRCGRQGGRPPFDPVLMFKILVIQAANNLSDERTEFLINDRLSFMRFLGLGLSDRVPDARTIWLFREKLTRVGAIKGLFERFEAALMAAGYIAMSGQIVDASLVAAPKQRNTADEKRDIKEGRIPDAWKARPGKLRQKDRDARWTVKFSKARERPDGTKPPVDIAIPTFGYQNHVGIDRGFGLIRTWMVTDAAAYEGARLREGLLDKSNTAAVVWADSAYRSMANETWLARNGFVSRVHRKKPPGKPMPERTRRANAEKSKVRSCIEHVFAEQKSRMGLFVRTIGIARAATKIGMANLVYNLQAVRLPGEARPRVRAPNGARPASVPYPRSPRTHRHARWPGHMPAANHRVDRTVQLARSHSPAAVQRIVKLMNGECHTYTRRGLRVPVPVPPQTQLAAAVALIERGFGKPVQPLAGDKNSPVTLQRIERVIVQLNGDDEALRILDAEPVSNGHSNGQSQ